LAEMRSREEAIAMRISRAHRRAVTVAAFATLSLAIMEPTYSQGPMSVVIDLSADLRSSAPTHSTDLQVGTGSTALFEFDPSVMVNAFEIALVSELSGQLEAARNPLGAKKYAKSFALANYSWGDQQYTCLNKLWNRESHWNYKARNPRSGAHGIAQALPATKMEIIATDWRTNPLTQIQWGLRYIEARYDTPCKAYAKFQRSRYY